jgi:Double zinc ribbon
MICPQCAHENPEDHKFCGECGTKLPPRPFVVNDYFQDRRQAHVGEANPMVKDAAERGNGLNSAAVRSRNTFSERDDKQIEESSIIDFPDKTQPERLDRFEAQHERTIGRTGPTHYAGGISGPSFLGLSSDPVPEKGFVYDHESGGRSEDEAYDSSYLLEETPRGTSWKAYALLLIVMIFGGLGYLQWKSQITRPPAADVSNVLGKNGDAIPEGGIPDFAKEKEKQQEQQKQNNSTAATDTHSANPAGTASATANPVAADNPSTTTNTTTPPNSDKGKTEGAKAQTSAGGVTVQSNGPRPQAGVTITTDDKRSTEEKADDGKPESDNNEADTPDQPVTKKAQGTAKSQAEETPQTLGAKDPLLIRAQKFLHGRGVLQDCRTGLNLLRQSAETNPKAQIQMGALYMTGHCVTQDRVSAYKWFSQALAQEPNNQYVERNRASLWASMTPEERTRVRQANFY